MADTACGSIRKLCVSTPAYLTWARANCCFNTKGINVPCNEVDWSNMRLSGLMDRHQWAFPRTSPPLPSNYQTGQYKLGKNY